MGEDKISRALVSFQDFLDCINWYGRIPSAKSDIAYERRQAFWLIHFKQAKRGKSTCRWDNGLQKIAEENGISQLFDVDSRTLRIFDLTDQNIAGFKVLGKSENVSEFGQVMWFCKNPKGELVDISSYDLRRMRDNIGYISMIKETKDFVGRNLGCWKLLGIYDIQDSGETVWFASHEDGKIEVVDKITFPSVEILTKYFSVIDNVTSETSGQQFVDLTAQKFGRWTAIGCSRKASNSEWLWFCVCDCGEISEVAGGKLRAGASLSCGCLRKDVLSKIAKDRIEVSVSS